MIGSEGRPVVQLRGRVADRDARAEAFTGLADRRALDAAYRYATLMLGDRAEAEDATHDAALAAWRHFADLRDPLRFDAWFGRILVNACRDRLRRRQREVRKIRVRDDDHEDEWPEEAASTARAGGIRKDDADTIVRRLALADALGTLGAAHREVIVLRFYADLTVDQIAERTGVGPGTVKSRLHYALRHLRVAIGEPDEEVHDGS